MKSVRVLVLGLVLVAATQAFGHSSYTGYSGAPGTDGSCASSCHGSGGGTIVVTGFPSTYQPGRTYLIGVAVSSGSSISNFNASVRIGTGTQTAGTITADLNTETYSTPGEPNGVHLASNDQDSCKFNWTAPNPGVGGVTLYLAGHQGATAGGHNTDLEITSQAAGIEEPGEQAKSDLGFRLERTLVSDRLVMRIGNLPAPARIRILDRGGRVIAKLRLSAGSEQTIAWPLLDRKGRLLSAGSYLAALNCNGRTQVRKFAVLKH
jgi:hypothetical protein